MTLEHRLTLTNAIGDVLDLSDLDSFAYELSGLGVKMSNTYADCSPSYITTGSKPEQSQGAFRLIFGGLSGGSQSQYKAFADFLAALPYVLSYETDAGEFKRDCILSQATRSHTGRFRAIDEEVTFDFLSPWYRWVTLRSNVADNADLEPWVYGKTYLAPSTTSTKVELVSDPLISSFASTTISPSLRAFCQVTNIGAPLEGNMLVVDGLNKPNDNASITFNGHMTTKAGKFEFWYRADEVDAANGEFSVSGKTRVIMDGREVIVQTTSTDTLFKMPETTSPGWHRIVVFFTTPTAATLRPKNHRGHVYFTAPSLYEVAIDSGQVIGYAYLPKYIYGDYTANELKQYGVFEIYNQSAVIGDAASPVIIRLSNASNPLWRLLQGSQVVQSDGYLLNVGANEVLEVSSMPNNQLAQKIQSDEVRSNVYDLQDISKTNFITIPKGSSTLVFEGVLGAIEVKYREERSLV